MFKLTNLLLPRGNVCTITEMYYHEKEADRTEYDFDEQKVSFQRLGEIYLDTYFNGFFIKKWIQYTGLNRLGVQLELKGSFRVCLMHKSLIGGEIVNSLICQHRFISAERKPFAFEQDVEFESGDGMYYIALRALEDESEFYGGFFYTDVPEHSVRPVNIAVVICTFKREKFIGRNLEMLKNSVFRNPESQLRGHLEVFISDNSKTLSKSLSDEEIHIYENKNVGGSGGFTRGIIEVLREKDRFTHVLLMDDDILLECESLERTYSLLALLKKGYEEAFVGGGMLRLDKQSVQVESGAVWTGSNLISLKTNLDMKQSKNVLINERSEYVSYNAWWYNCIPLSKVTETNLPLPIFIRGDDIEYGLRNTRTMILMSGICVWHEPFENKYSAFLNYYILRNQLILNSLHSEEFKARNAVMLLFRNVARELVYYRYDNLKIVFRGFRDYLKGIRFLLETDGEALHKGIMAMATKMSTVEELGEKYKCPILLGEYESQLNKTDKGIKRLFRFITINGYLIPKLFYRHGSRNRYAIVSVSQCHPVNFYRYKTVVHFDLISGKGFVTKINKSKLFSTGAEFLGLALQLLFGGYKKARNNYRENIDKVTNLMFWETYLGLNGNQEPASGAQEKAEVHANV